MSANEKFYRFDGLTVDCENFRVQKDGQTLALTPLAFDVLLFLIRNNGRVVEKQELFDHVWKETFVSDNALTKIVKEIRHAFADDASTPRYIVTVPKRGYRFIAELSKPPAAADGVKAFRIPNDPVENENPGPKTKNQNLKAKGFA